MKTRLDFSRFKHLLFEKKHNGDIVYKRYLFFVKEYVRKRSYSDMILALKFLRDQGFNKGIRGEIEALLQYFQSIPRSKKIDVSQFEYDKRRYRLLLDSIDPQECPPAKGKIREIQLKELAFLKEILEDIYKNTDIKPFADGGTLIGAARHKGFIPWDDDVDMALVRNDFERLVQYLSNRYIYINSDSFDRYHEEEVLRGLFEQYPNQVFCFRKPLCFKVYKGTADDHVVVEFFALDFYNENHNVLTLQKYAKMVKKIVYNREWKYRDIFNFYKNEILRNLDIVDDSDVLGPGIDNYDFYYYSIKAIRRKSDIFPLKKLPFEDTFLYAPCNTKEYLKSSFTAPNKFPDNFSIGKTFDFLRDEIANKDDQR